MKKNQLPWLLLVSALGVSALQAQNNFSFEGTFLTDDQVQLFDFTLTSPETVTFQTWGIWWWDECGRQPDPAGRFREPADLVRVRWQLYRQLQHLRGR